MQKYVGSLVGIFFVTLSWLVVAPTASTSNHSRLLSANNQTAEPAGTHSHTENVKQHCAYPREKLILNDSRSAYQNYNQSVGWLFEDDSR